MNNVLWFMLEPETKIPTVQHEEPVQYDEQNYNQEPVQYDEQNYQQEDEQQAVDQQPYSGEQQGTVTVRALYDYQAGENDFGHKIIILELVPCIV